MLDWLLGRGTLRTPQHRPRLPAHDDSASSSSSSTSTSSDSEYDGYNTSSTHPPPSVFPPRPNLGDVTTIRLFLTKYHHPALPPELALQIIDFAEYWPSVTASLSRPTATMQTGGRGGHHAVLVTPSLPAHAAGVGSVTWWIKSNDQGWSGEPRELHGTYGCSWTWFEAVILRPRGGAVEAEAQKERGKINANGTSFSLERVLKQLPRKGGVPIVGDDLPDWGANWMEVEEPETKRKRWHVQFNASTKATPGEHTIIWRPGTNDELIHNDVCDYSTGSGYGERFIKMLKPGDRVALIARALYPGWVNTVQGAKVEVCLLS